MTALPFNQVRARPRMKDLLDQLKRDIFLTLNCHAVATVIAVDYEAGTIDAQMNYQKTVTDSQGNQSPVNYPSLQGVPAIALCGGATYLSFPVKPKDQALILFNDRDLDNWIQGATGGQLNSPRLHSFSDPLAIVGLNDISAWDAVRALLTNGNVAVGINPETDKATIKNANGTLNTILQSLITGILGMTAGGNMMVDATGDIGTASTALGNLLE